jgi:hypothetical protein
MQLEKCEFWLDSDVPKIKYSQVYESYAVKCAYKMRGRSTENLCSYKNQFPN